MTNSEHSERRIRAQADARTTTQHAYHNTINATQSTQHPVYNNNSHPNARDGSARPSHNKSSLVSRPLS
ncbi:hypothetical protein L211DRAFT_836044 [Terfezia boudieri ATCC MYA-4762]|uniref:Uncharacterized protein n=1 Tax=Terfezia boudieri ATCC MYA-4762 TaxID=1051890 RepID=A0A3N4LT11_9PEZI|nr:hypothetical protein L211DRAFT_836044 [Terfezia boudieri ATCC MYA-4762]